MTKTKEIELLKIALKLACEDVIKCKRFIYKEGYGWAKPPLDAEEYYMKKAKEV